jgi:hypothetical protein
MGRGRPKKTQAQHEIDGTFRADRHQSNEPAAEGVPYQIIALSGAALELWNQLVPQLVRMKVAKEIDSFALCTMCRLAAKIHDVLGDEDIDEYKRSGAVSAILKQLNVYVEKFGLTPVDRKKMSVAGGDEENPFAAFLMGLDGGKKTDNAGAHQQGAGRTVHRGRAPRKDRGGKAREGRVPAAPRRSQKPKA